MLAGGGAVPHPPGDALQDRGDAEEIVGEVDIEAGPWIEAGTRCISFDIALFGRNAERAEVVAGKRTGAAAGVSAARAPCDCRVSAIVDT